jgi:hypothetical protein
MQAHPFVEFHGLPVAPLLQPGVIICSTTQQSMCWCQPTTPVQPKLQKLTTDN